MASGQLPAEVEEFATYLRGLTRRLDAGAGWYGVFALRDPDGLRACLDGLEVPPWDLVQSLLQDLSAQHGPGAAHEAASRAATLYRASVAAHDAGPGRREALQDRLDGMLRQRGSAARRATDLRSALSTAEDPAARHSLAAELAWAHDDYQRATARTEELHARLAALPGVSRSALPPDAAVARPPGTLASAAGPAWDGAGRAGNPRGAGFAVAYEGEGGGVAEAATGPGVAPLGRAAREGGAAEAATGPGAAPLGHVAHVAHEPGSAGSGGEPAVAGADEPAQSSAASPGPMAVQHAPAPARSRPRGARFAGAAEAVTAPGVPTPEVAATARTGPMSPGIPAGASAPAADASFEPTAQVPGPTTTAPAPMPAPVRARPRGARFAGAGDGDPAVAPTSAPSTPPPLESGAEAGATPRGARFAGAYEGEDGGKRRKRDRVADDGRRLARAAAERAAARRAAQEAVARLGRLRAEGRSGEAHVVLYEAAAWPAARLPVLAEELERAGLGADVSTLLWETACLPPAQLAAAAEALVAADREADGEGLLRQSVSRPVPEVAHTAKALLAAGAPSRAAFLLEALVRARTPEDAARAAAEDPATLVPLLLDAAAGVSAGTHHDLAHALRTARLPGVPGLA
ncbi:hypothetical protein [Streptomyces iranensis]|uniref:hypothetical protein n=1 Tax=Streptomyces iranensis TaxID=576784 RepID=UPI0039B7541D